MASAEAPFIRFHRLFEVRPNGCWEWTASTMNSGYGQFKVFGKMTSAHRFAYTLYKGEVGYGREVLHTCDNKACVNPDHLRSGTHSENMREAAERGLMRSGCQHNNYGVPQNRPKQSKPVMVLGVDYPSINSAERALGLCSGTVAYWLKNKPEKANLLPKEI